MKNPVPGSKDTRSQAFKDMIDFSKTIKVPTTYETVKLVVGDLWSDVIITHVSKFRNATIVPFNEHICVFYDEDHSEFSILDFRISISYFRDVENFMWNGKKINKTGKLIYCNSIVKLHVLYDLYCFSFGITGFAQKEKTANCFKCRSCNMIAARTMDGYSI